MYTQPWPVRQETVLSSEQLDLIAAARALLELPDTRSEDEINWRPATLREKFAFVLCRLTFKASQHGAASGQLARRFSEIPLRLHIRTRPVDMRRWNTIGSALHVREEIKIDGATGAKTESLVMCKLAILGLSSVDLADNDPPILTSNPHYLLESIEYQPTVADLLGSIRAALALEARR